MAEIKNSIEMVKIIIYLESSFIANRSPFLVSHMYGRKNNRMPSTMESIWFFFFLLKKKKKSNSSLTFICNQIQYKFVIALQKRERERPRNRTEFR